VKLRPAGSVIWVISPKSPGAGEERVIVTVLPFRSVMALSPAVLAKPMIRS